MNYDLENSTEQKIIRIHEPTFLELVLPIVGFAKYRSRTTREVEQSGISFSDCLGYRYKGILKLGVVHGLEEGIALLSCLYMLG